MRICRVPWGVLLAAAVAAGCSKNGVLNGNGKKNGAAAPVPVRAATVAQRPMPVQVQTFGTVEANATVEIKSQIGGLVTEENLEAGTAVKAGAVLYRIDSRPYAAVLRQAEAALARDRVLAADAVRKAEAAETLFRKGVGSEDEMKNSRATADALNAQVEADAAEVEKARLDLGYCEIRAPFDGRAGDLLIRRGSQVKAGDGVLTTLAQTKPVFVTFAIPQTRLPEVRAAMAAHPLTVTATLRGADAPAGSGTLVFIDNGVDAASGTIKLKAEFPNADEALWPGQFVQVALVLREEADDLVIPGAAVQNGQRGTYVYVVTPQRVQETREIQAGKSFAGDLVTVEEGVYAGATLIMDGKEVVVESRPPEKPGTDWFSRLWGKVRPPRSRPYLLAPKAAIQSGTGKNAGALTVTLAEFAVELRPVVIARSINDHAVIAAGLQPGERVVTDGQIRLVPGARVTVMKDK